jgi:hypothetical protein
MFAGTLLLLVALARTGSFPAPQEPYLDWGACPFECCKYGRWIATRDVPSFSSRTTSSPAPSVIRKGERVVAETGVVVTTRLGRMVATRPIQLGEGRRRVAVPEGAVFYVLHYWGEGYFAYWYNGETYSDPRYLEPTSREPRAIGGSGALLLQTPEWAWWVRIRTRAGRTAWVQGNQGFDGADGCGG